TLRSVILNQSSKVWCVCALCIVSGASGGIAITVSCIFPALATEPLAYPSSAALGAVGGFLYGMAVWLSSKPSWWRVWVTLLFAFGAGCFVASAVSVVLVGITRA